MSIVIECGKTLGTEAVVSFIMDMDSEFPDPISNKCNVVSYANKLINCRQVICAVENNKIIGL